MILNFPSITAKQIAESLLAIPAFLPVTVCTGYLAAWFTDLYGFRQRSLIERIFWSVPLSLAVSTIALVLTGKFLGLSAMVVLLAICAALWIAVLGREMIDRRLSGTKWKIGWRPLGTKAMALAVGWTAVVILSLVELQSGSKLFPSVVFFDHAARANWTESVLRTGIPPANPFYLFQHPAVMRNYYFWYVDCAAVARMAHLRAGPVLIASCVWAGFALAALTGLYLKHFLEAGARLRVQYLLSVSLFAVTGLDICAVLWNLFFLHNPWPGDLEWWSRSQIASWLDSLFWAPHHIASLVCCMVALLLAWMGAKGRGRQRIASGALIAAALASAFGLSVYVAFAFFLVMLPWAFWQVSIERTSGPAALLAAGGAGAGILLAPYLSELTRRASGTSGSAGSLFIFAVREIIPPEGLLATSVFNGLSKAHPLAARNLANLLLLVPGYTLELGFFLAILLVYLVPAWRGRTRLTKAGRSLVFIAAAALPIITFIRSSVLISNDFGWRGALVLQFPLLLLASEAITGWRFADCASSETTNNAGLPCATPQWMRSTATLALMIGIVSTVCQGLVLRFAFPLGDSNSSAAHASNESSLTHNLYISSIGYAKLDASIPSNAVVQFNPAPTNDFWMKNVDLLGVDHQVAIVSDKHQCGAELGGDPAGCPVMAAAIDALYKGTSAERARATCREHGIQYLVARIYDPAWKEKGSWVWTLQPVVSDDEFRAVNCR